MIKLWKTKKKELENQVGNIDLQTKVSTGKGEKSIEELIKFFESYNEQNANKDDECISLNEESVIDIDGVKMSMGELRDRLKNQGGESEEEKRKKEEEMKNEEEKKKKEEEEKKNQEEEEKKKKEEEMKNALEKEKREQGERDRHFADLQNKAHKRETKSEGEGEGIGYETMQEKLKRGQRLYGSKNK